MPIIDLFHGMRIELKAVSPTDGSDVAGVSLSLGVAYGIDILDRDVDDGTTLPVFLQPPSGGG